jgi:hypothetical protein
VFIIIRHPLKAAAHSITRACLFRAQRYPRVDKPHYISPPRLKTCLSSIVLGRPMVYFTRAELENPTQKQRFHTSQRHAQKVSRDERYPLPTLPPTIQSLSTIGPIQAATSPLQMSLYKLLLRWSPLSTTLVEADHRHSTTTAARSEEHREMRSTEVPDMFSGGNSSTDSGL